MDDIVTLSRIQFALTIMFHYIYPPLSIGLGTLMVVMNGMYLKTGDKFYEKLTQFWTKIFALIFGLGVATGIIMEFEFGTNWANYSRFVGDVFGSALASEGLFAFFLESGFLGVLLFGWDKVSPKFHFVATLMVAIGSTFSAAWIVIANSWMQTPAGYHIVGEGLKARAEIDNFWAMVFNPSALERLSHVVIGSWLAGAFLVISISSYYLLKKKHIRFAKTSLKIALIFSAFASSLQLFSGHISADGVSKNQPAKLAAYEGHYDSSKAGNMYIFGWVDEKKEEVKGIGLTGGLSFLLYQDFNKPVTGLDKFKKEDRPRVNVVFQTYHIMIAIGMGLIGISYLGLFLMWKGKLYENTLFLKLLVVSVLGPQIANQTGWISAEMGRQPWIVYGLMKTSDGVSKALTQHNIIFSLILFTLIYALLFILFLFLLDQKIKHGPDDEDSSEKTKEDLVLAGG